MPEKRILGSGAKLYVGVRPGGCGKRGVDAGSVGLMGEAIAFNGVCRNFRGFSLRDVTLSVEAGSIMGLLGPNGAGKTTIIKLILNLLHLHGGSISVFGLDSRAHEMEIKKRLGYVAEKDWLPPHASAGWLEELLSACYPTWDSSLYRGYLDRLEVPTGKPARALSKGTVVKLALAGALAHRPDLLVLDEPTSGLDPLVRYEVVDLLRELARSDGVTVLFSTHIVSDLESAADSVTILSGGRVLASEPKERLLGRFGRDGGERPGLEEVFRRLVHPRARGSDGQCSGD
jgi:ABC-2 type transport system ATP-binding protein